MAVFRILEAKARPGALDRLSDLLEEEEVHGGTAFVEPHGGPRIGAHDRRSAARSPPGPGPAIWSLGATGAVGGPTGNGTTRASSPVQIAKLPRRVGAVFCVDYDVI